jgi:hypothetical protein
VTGRGRINGRRRRARLPFIPASIAVLLAVAGCSSSSVEYAADAYPSQSLADLLKKSTDSPPPSQKPDFPRPARMNDMPAPPSSSPPAARGPSAPPPPEATPSPPAAVTAPSEDADLVAAAYPSVSLIDLLTGAKKPAQQ